MNTPLNNQFQPRTEYTVRTRLKSHFGALRKSSVGSAIYLDEVLFLEDAHRSGLHVHARIFELIQIPSFCTAPFYEHAKWQNGDVVLQWNCGKRHKQLTWLSKLHTNAACMIPLIYSSRIHANTLGENLRRPYIHANDFLFSIKIEVLTMGLATARNLHSLGPYRSLGRLMPSINQKNN